MSKTQPEVIAFVQPFVPSYRKGLFDAIALKLAEHGYRLEVWHDEPKGIVAARRNASSGEWSVPIKQHRLSVARRNVTYRHIAKRARTVRAIVLGLASSNLETYLIARDPRVTMMLWGHGRNFTAGNNPLDARLEQWLGRRATHIFTYTDRGARHLIETGTDPAKVTTVVNSVDTRALRENQALLPAGYEAQTRADYAIANNAHVGLFVGAFDEPTRLPFLLAAADLLHAARPDVVMLLAGAGPLDDYVREQADARGYVRLIGRLSIDELARLSNLVHVLLMPGRVGLVAVDALALGLPLATTHYPFHAPEADYLAEETSLWTADDVEAYAAGVVQLLSDEPARQAMSERARIAGNELSVERSAENFVAGLIKGIGEH